MLSLRGNDASCLNLNQVQQPTMLGIHPAYFDKRKAFSFSQLDPGADNQHPWLTLNKALAADVIPCFADQTVITYGMQKKIGDTLFYTTESGKVLKVKIMGGLNNSVFQGNILVSAEIFSKFFPSAGSSERMLIGGDFRKQKIIAERLEYIFQDFGMVVTPASERLAQFNSVENTYLSVFMLLGGLGVLIGTIGLGIVVFKTVRERAPEIALYQAIGFDKRVVLHLVAAEYLFILISGLLIGTLSAFIGLIPSILMNITPIPWGFIAAILLAIFMNGLLWIVIPVRNVLRKNLVKSLRTE
jgi:ABC-type antimicrobial peptide transport system permease subunit